ncbi:PAS domain-containing sensor histidine kinase [Carboxylicivirga sp. M1479]|uniref:sensor histidine kinase n=1 Tax=Carboxylicivirga sp. M1479 TaxID=2594476 RepID=UPI001177A02B|nr:ATP-binding protein [Carboxylicivirga sp. M1479]TRX72657.1 hypothetical protein FNN09_01580 [Carboxylicivirga sp. M1479]
MSYKHFTYSIALQALFMALTPIIILLIWSNQSLDAIKYLLAFAYIAQTVYLIYSVRKTNRELAKFIQSFGFGDTTIHFHSRDKDASFQNLFQSFNSVVEAFRQLKLDKEKEYLFFETALKKLGVAIIVVNEHGNVTMTNEALLKMLNIKYLHRLDKLNQFKPGIADELMQLQANQQKLVELMVDQRLLQVALTSVMMKQEQKTLRLLAFQDIRGEIEQKELESWQKLIRVLTHEVMNSLSPVNIISAGLNQRFKQTEAPIVLDEKERLEVTDALDAVHKRSKGLTHFVESYRSMAGLKHAQTQLCDINSLLTRVQTLFTNSEHETKFQLLLECDKNTSYLLDEQLLEQTLINLIKNSIEALDKEPALITIKAHIRDHLLKIQIIDNGKGIPPDELDKVCVPFYTTRQGGNGIGLALSQQVMRLHGGQLQIQSEVGKGSRVTLLFK